MLSIHQDQVFPPCPAPFNLAAHALRRAGELAQIKAARALRLAGVNDFVLLELEDAFEQGHRRSLVPGAHCLAQADLRVRRVAG